MAEQFTKSIVVNADISRVFQVWSNYHNFPRFMKYIKSVDMKGPGLSHWVMEGPVGKELEWDAKTTAMDENRRIAWKSTDGDIDTSGEATFRKVGADQTEVTLTLSYVSPAGTIGDFIARLFQDPERRAEEDLKNFKEYVESMEPATAERRI